MPVIPQSSGRFPTSRGKAYHSDRCPDREARGGPWGVARRRRCSAAGCRGARSRSAWRGSPAHLYRARLCGRALRASRRDGPFLAAVLACGPGAPCCGATRRPRCTAAPLGRRAVRPLGADLPHASRAASVTGRPDRAHAREGHPGHPEAAHSTTSPASPTRRRSSGRSRQAMFAEAELQHFPRTSSSSPPFARAPDRRTGLRPDGGGCIGAPRRSIRPTACRAGRSSPTCAGPRYA